jgi:hypothetical protein
MAVSPPIGSGGAGRIGGDGASLHPPNVTAGAAGGGGFESLLDEHATSASANTALIRRL